jgi:hypothetical protein
VKPLVSTINFIGTKGGIVTTVNMKPGCCLDKKTPPKKTGGA